MAFQGLLIPSKDDLVKKGFHGSGEHSTSNDRGNAEGSTCFIDINYATKYIMVMQSDIFYFSVRSLMVVSETFQKNIKNILVYYFFVCICA